MTPNDACFKCSGDGWFWCEKTPGVLMKVVCYMCATGKKRDSIYREYETDEGRIVGSAAAPGEVENAE